ncbi:FliA/WhiG family RNA polymerase sigma factor [Desulfotalea psychrophila]|uniref:Related to RNA polymerase sigma factor (FliA) n=1 Tax=Desulfotalea psychrophila (strain LSv54 / DSM 12343) TaxID=177439 RepID=Q6AJS3_DESPS|nr:FliA/WhiG family RNA polymerase sigma factor [Desulfotalea psychrophila]CAG37407.1 related to RNA polymerase sigma factor (FliA) [Desulfotalea psychrophila LSv54]
MIDIFPTTPPGPTPNQLVDDHLYLVDILVSRMVSQVPSFMSRDDMRSAGMFGLFDASKKFDASKNILFKTFAEYRIRGAIFDEMRKLDWFSRSLRDKHNKIGRAILALELKLGRDPEEFEIAQSLNMNLDAYHNLLGQVSHLGCVSLNEVLDNSQEGRSFLDSLVDKRKNNTPTAFIEQQELNIKIAEILDQLSEKEKLVISLYYYEELSQKEIAEVIGVSEGRISQLHSQSLIKLKLKMQNQLF